MPVAETFDETRRVQEQPPVPAVDEGAPPEPSRLGRWLLALALFIAYLPMQVLLAVPAVAVVVVVGGVTSLEDLLQSDIVLWMTLGAAALAAALTIVVALVWPRLWALFTSRPVPLREWLAWRQPEVVPLWSVPFLTLPLLVVIGLVVSLLFGPAEIEIQLQLFSTPALQFASAVVVSTVVPVAEELIFRGALYNAVQPRAAEVEPGRRREIVPFAVTALAFASVHLLAGFETVAAIVQIVILSSFLSGLRAVTGSVKPSIVAHLVWNLTAALGLIVSTSLNLPGT